MIMRKGHLFVISGPSGAGKGTILKRALPQLTDISFSVSCTTRKPREEDVEGTTYFFITKDKFKSMIANSEFIEWAEVHGNFYGTKKEYVLSEIEKGKDVFLEIDVQGALQVKKILPEAVTIFIKPPSIDVLKERLICRGTESASEFDLRVSNAKKEVELCCFYDAIVINDSLDNSVDEFIKIVKNFRGNQ